MSQILWCEKHQSAQFFGICDKLIHTRRLNGEGDDGFYCLGVPMLLVPVDAPMITLYGNESYCLRLGKPAGRYVLVEPSRYVLVEPSETTHGCPPRGSGETPCCGRSPFELPSTDRITLDDALVTCRVVEPSEGGE